MRSFRAMDYHIDANGRRLGHVASEIAELLQGKRRTAYDPSKLSRDRVLVKNYAAISVSGRKRAQKLYHRHTGYMGHLKTLTFAQAFEKNPKAVIRNAVRRMLPKNFLNQKRLRNLVFVD
jgi:large subunit ribosomal protein L13